MLEFTRTCKSDKGDEKFLLPDLVKLVNHKFLVPGETITMPLYKKKKVVCFFEMGGRNPEYNSSIATIVANKDGSIPTALLFNKKNKEETNGRHAYVAMKPGISVYVGRVSTKSNPLAPTIRVVKLSFIKELDTSGDVIICSFNVDEIYTTYDEVKDIVPITRLLKKLFTDYVTRPFYANGWTISDLSRISTTAQYQKIMDVMSDFYAKTLDTKPIESADEYLDLLEQHIVDNSDADRLSGVIQIMDFKRMIMTMIPVLDITLTDIGKSISKCKMTNSFSVDIGEFIASTYNPSVSFDAKTADSLLVGLLYDKRYTLKLDDSIFGMIRAYRG